MSPNTPCTGDRSRGVAAAALGELVSAVNATNRILADLRHRRAAERAALHGETGVTRLLQPDGDCCVCYEPLDRPHAVVTACGHVYHRACIENAMESGRTRRCPICRRLVDSAELVQIMNGLPTRTAERTSATSADDCNDVAFVDSNDDVIDLTQTAPRLAAANDGGGAARRREDTGLDLDREIQAMLERGRRVLDDSNRLRALEDSVEAMLESASSMVTDAKKQAKEEKSKLLAEVKEKTMAVKVRETKLRIEEDALRQSKSLLNDQIADARRRAEELAISIKATEAANSEAIASKAASDQARVQCEERRLRFQRLASQFEKKAQQHKSEREKIALLGQENRRLESLVQALRKQLRKTKGLPPEPSARANERKSGPSNELPNLNWATEILLEKTKNSNSPVQNVVEENLEDEAFQDADLDDDDDVVGAADQIYNRKQVAGRRSTERGGYGMEPVRAMFVETFGPLAGPPVPPADLKSDSANSARVPSVPGVSRLSARKGVALGAFCPDRPTVQSRPGPIAASDSKTMGPSFFCNQTARRLGVKRAIAPDGNKSRVSKMKNSKIEFFLK